MKTGIREKIKLFKKEKKFFPSKLIQQEIQFIHLDIGIWVHHQHLPDILNGKLTFVEEETHAPSKDFCLLKIFGKNKNKVTYFQNL